MTARPGHAWHGERLVAVLSGVVESLDGDDLHRWLQPMPGGPLPLGQTAVYWTDPREDKLRTGPLVTGFAPRLDQGVWPRTPTAPAAPNRPAEGAPNNVFDMMAELLDLFYCCYNISCRFTLGDEPIAGSDGTDIKDAQVIQFESPAENLPGRIPHVGAWFDGAKLQTALDKRLGRRVEWDNIDDIAYDLKPSVAGSSESSPPSKSDIARRYARARPTLRLPGPFVFANRRWARAERGR